MGLVVAESTVRQLVRERKIARRETSLAKAYVPLSFTPAERGEVDFGHAVVRLHSEEVQVPFLAAVEDGPLAATQFHPEKSGDAGAAVLSNWVEGL